MKPEIAIIGSCVCDVIIEVPHIPKTQEDVNIQHQSLSLGGCAYNVANILQLFDIPFVLFAPIGTGMYGDFVKKGLKKNGLTSLLDSIDEENGCCYCLVEDHKERTFLSYHGAEYRFQEEWFHKLEDYPIHTVYICGLEIEEETGQHILTYLKKHPTITIYFAPGPRICEIDQEKIDALCALSCILHLNDDEALRYTKQKDITEAAKILYDKTNAPLIITLGSKGSSIYDGKQMIHIPAEKVNVIDTIGAGDAHIGSIIASRYQHKDWQACLLQANIVAATVVSKKGAGLDTISCYDLSFSE